MQILNQHVEEQSCNKKNSKCLLLRYDLLRIGNRMFDNKKIYCDQIIKNKENYTYQLFSTPIKKLN